MDEPKLKTRIQLIKEEIIDISNIINLQFIEREILSRTDEHEAAVELSREISLCQTRKEILKELLEESKKAESEDFIELQAIMEIRNNEIS